MAQQATTVERFLQAIQALEQYAMTMQLPYELIVPPQGTPSICVVTKNVHDFHIEVCKLLKHQDRLIKISTATRKHDGDERQYEISVTPY